MEKKSFRAAILEPVGGHGGMNYYDFGLATGLEESGCKTFLYTCNETKAPEWAKFELKLTYHNIYGNDHKLIRALRFVKGVFASLFDIRKNHIPIVHLHFFHAGAMEMLTVRLAKLLGLKLVITVHDVESFSGDDSIKTAARIFGMADRLIAHNVVSRQELIDKMNMPKDRINIIPHGNYISFVTPKPSKAAARERLGLVAEAEVLLFFGQIKQVKGLDVLLEAFHIVRKQNPNVVLLVAGRIWKDGFSKCQQIIDDLGLAPSLKMDIRYIPDDETPLYYSAADVVVLPYRKIYQSGVLLMAMSFERAVVASNLAGMSEIVTEGETGYLFETGDAISLSHALDRALASPEERNRIATAGLRLMENQYGWSHIGKETRNVYQQVISDVN